MGRRGGKPGAGGGQRIRGGVLWKRLDLTRVGLHGPHAPEACHFLLVPWPVSASGEPFHDNRRLSSCAYIGDHHFWIRYVENREGKIWKDMHHIDVLRVIRVADRVGWIKHAIRSICQNTEMQSRDSQAQPSWHKLAR